MFVTINPIIYKIRHNNFIECDAYLITFQFVYQIAFKIYTIIYNLILDFENVAFMDVI